MSEKDLMIGDWVEVQFKSNGDIHKERMSHLPSSIFKHSELFIVNPIPITKEILKKNGFNVGMYSTLDLDEHKWLEYYHHEHRLRLWWKGIDEFENHSEVADLVFQCNAIYVHELQHALRLCNIDKEIQL